MKSYQHTQIGYVLLSAYAAVVLIIIYLNIVTAFHQAAATGLTIMLIAVALFATLRVDVGDEMIMIRFGLGIIRKSFPLKEISAYRVVKNPWYYGWGVRYSPRGWLFSVSGFSAIELQMRNGKLYRIGTDEPKRLAKALGDALDK